MASDKILSPHEFVINAIETLRVPPNKGIHTVRSGFNKAFKEYFPDLDPDDITRQMAREGAIVIYLVKGGAFIYKAEEATPPTIPVTLTNTGRHWILLASLLCIIWFPILVSMNLSCEQRTYGPSTDEIMTRGVFKPGGFIDFRVWPAIGAINAYQHTTVTIKAELDKDLQEKGIYWLPLQEEISNGWPWGDKIYELQQSVPVGGGAGFLITSPVFDIRLDIPDNSLLSRERVNIVFNAEVVCPITYDEKHFVDAKKDIRETFEIMLDGTGKPVPPWERGWIMLFGVIWVCLLGPAIFGLFLVRKHSLLASKRSKDVE